MTKMQLIEENTKLKKDIHTLVMAPNTIEAYETSFKWQFVFQTTEAIIHGTRSLNMIGVGSGLIAQINIP